MVREGPVRLEEVRHRLDRQALENGWKHDSAHAVPGVDHDAQRLHHFEVDEGQDGVDPTRPDVLLADLSSGLTPGHVVNGHSSRAYIQEARVAADGKCTAADDLQPGVLLRVV